jgi:hypothetical protein
MRILVNRRSLVATKPGVTHATDADALNVHTKSLRLREIL